MYAQAGIIGRVARERRDKRRKRYSKGQLPGDAESQLSKDDSERISQDCFLPCLRGPSILAVVALILLVLGGVLCNFAFHAEKYSRIEYPGANNTVNVTSNYDMYKGLQSLSYLGPISIGLGVFLIIVVCVTVFEKRESMIKDLAKRKSEIDQRLKCEYSYKMALDTLNPSEKALTDTEAGSTKDTQSLLHSITDLNDHELDRLSPAVFECHQVTAFTITKCASEPPRAPCSLDTTAQEEPLPPSPPKEYQSYARDGNDLPSDEELPSINGSRCQSSDRLNDSTSEKLYSGCMENAGYEQSSYSLRNAREAWPTGNPPNASLWDSTGDQPIENLAQLHLMLEEEHATDL